MQRLGKPSGSLNSCAAVMKEFAGVSRSGRQRTGAPPEAWSRPVRGATAAALIGAGTAITAVPLFPFRLCQ